MTYEEFAAAIKAHTQTRIGNLKPSAGGYMCLMCDVRIGYEGDFYERHLAQYRESLFNQVKATALLDAVSDFESNVGVGEFAEQTVRDGVGWAQPYEAWDHQGPYMDWLRNRADSIQAGQL